MNYYWYIFMVSHEKVEIFFGYLHWAIIKTSLQLP